MAGIRTVNIFADFFIHSYWMPYWRHSALFVHISFFCHFLCSKLMNNKLVTFPSRTLRNQNPIELWVCFFFLLKENRRSEKNCREQLDSNSGLLWLNSRQTVIEVIIAHWKFEQSIFFLVHLKERYHEQEQSDSLTFKRRH